MLTPPKLLHLSGPLQSTAQLVVSICHRAGSGTAESRVPSCTFGGSKHKRQPLTRSESWKISESWDKTRHQFAIKSKRQTNQTNTRLTG